jgi:hypothetical protein
VSTEAAAAAPAGATLERERRRLLNRFLLLAYMWRRLPLGACAGLRVLRLDDEACTVRLPGGWRTRNPFGSAYFAAQMMAAELATGAPAMLLVRSGSASIALILREAKGTFVKRVLGPSHYTFADLAGMRAAVAAAAGCAESVAYTARVVGHTAAGETASEFEVTWSFKRRS